MSASGKAAWVIGSRTRGITFWRKSHGSQTSSEPSAMGGIARILPVPSPPILLIRTRQYEERKTLAQAFLFAGSRRSKSLQFRFSNTINLLIIKTTMPLFEITRWHLSTSERLALSTALQNMAQELGWYIDSVHINFIEWRFDMDNVNSCTYFYVNLPNSVYYWILSSMNTDIRQARSWTGSKPGPYFHQSLCWRHRCGQYAEIEGSNREGLGGDAECGKGECVGGEIYAAA